MKRLQLYIQENLLETLRLYAKSQGASLAQVLREAGQEFIKKPAVREKVGWFLQENKKKVKNPLLEMAGMLKGGLTKTSVTVDDIYNSL